VYRQKREVRVNEIIHPSILYSSHINNIPCITGMTPKPCTKTPASELYSGGLRRGLYNCDINCCAVYRAERMADPHAGAPEPPRTTTQGTTTADALENPDSTTAPRTRRQARPSDGHTISARSHAETTSTGDHNGRVTTREIWRLIDGLKETIAYQTELIQSTKNELLEVKHEQSVIHTQNENLHEEVRALRAQIDALPSTPVAKLWAAVAASHPPLQPNHQRTDKDQNCVRINTQRSFVDSRDNDNGEQSTFGRYLPTGTANTHIRSALLSAPTTQDAQVAGVGTTKTGYVIRFKDPESAEAARINSEWLNELGNNTKLVKPRIGVVVHRTPTECFDLENANAQAIEKIMEENDLIERDFHIEELAWLKKRDKALGMFASLGIWFDSAEGADCILDKGFLVGQRYIGSVERREIRKKRCFRCQRFGHLAWSCKETPRCGHCAGQHKRDGCPLGTRARCLDCSGEHPTGDRSDHRATYSEWNLRAQRQPAAKAKKAYDRADWCKIAEDVLRQMGPWTEAKKRPALDEAVAKLTEATATAVDRYTPNLRPTPYSKRWFTPDLKIQQTEVNHLRRKWQRELCGARATRCPLHDPLPRDTSKTTNMDSDHRESQNVTLETILRRGRGRKALESSHLHEATRGLGVRAGLARWYQRPTENEEKAQAFLDAFFPQMDEPDGESPTRAPLELPWHPITELEIQRSLKAAKGSTAPGRDGVPTLVWKQLWKHLNNHITGIFTASISLGYHPRRWRSAKIVVLRKPKKPDYSVPGAYRPISLLNTLGKLLEAVMARRPS
ncbi:hypothetical protein VN97_g11989, partial [Penicillium thymicola]